MLHISYTFTVQVTQVNTIITQHTNGTVEGGLDPESSRVVIPDASDTAMET